MVSMPSGEDLLRIAGMRADLERAREALTEISEVIDYYKGGFSYQGLYSIRAILKEVDVEPDEAVVKGEKPSPLSIEGRSGKPRRVKADSEQQETEEEER